MTTNEQRGYDDQRAGRLDEALATGDGADARAYREGARRARRDAADEAEGFTPHRAAQRTDDFLAPVEPVSEWSVGFPGAAAAPAEEDAPREPAPIGRSGGGAFYEPPDPKPKRARPSVKPPQDQLGLF